MIEKIKVKFYGTGGSCPVNALRRKKYGGNTSCIMLLAGERGIIFDMGTGIIEVEEDIKALGLHHIDILMSHYHYDHIDGFPFIRPILEKAEVCSIYGPDWMGKSMEQVLDGYMCPPYFPVRYSIYGGLLTYNSIVPGQTFELGSIQVSTCSLNHPGGAVAYRVDCHGESVVYLLDNELKDESQGVLTEFCKNASLVICDAYFTHSEISEGMYDGWGHSSYEQGVELARDAGAKLLALTHHSISRTDEELDRVDALIKEQHQGAFLAYDGLEIVI